MSAAFQALLAEGQAHRAAGRLAEAEAAYRRILAADPHQADALDALGVLAFQAGQAARAVELLGRAIAAGPDSAPFHNHLGQVYSHQQRWSEALACLRRSLELAPDFAESHNDLGMTLLNMGQLAEAEGHLRRAQQLQPDLWQAGNNLSIVLVRQGRMAEAIAVLQQAVAQHPANALLYNALGAAYQKAGRIPEAIAAYQRTLQLRPDYAEAYNNLGLVLKDQGLLSEALDLVRRALELKPSYLTAHSNLLFFLNFCHDVTPAMIRAELDRWYARHAAPLAGDIRPHANDRTPGRRLRIGYVSPDLWMHAVGLFLLPILETHDRRQYEIYCYAAVHAPDAVTRRCRAAAHVWRDVQALTDQRLAECIRDDRIDILVDLAMHTAENRLLVFARKPAPVQVTYLAYAGSTGLPTVDYRLCDRYLDPPGRTMPYVETALRLPDSWWCYRPLVAAPDVAPLPALRERCVTFGCLNGFAKATPPTLAAWAQLLQVVPNARLLLYAHQGSHRQRVLDLFAAQGVAPQRIAFTTKVPLEDYYRLYQQIDVALDPFPYGGGTTTFDALWMGVPVVTLAGETAVGRGGLSILANLGLTACVAGDPTQYVAIAAELVRDLPRLAALRAQLRGRLQQSPLCDVPRFTRNLEVAYRQMWARWCAGQET